MKTPGLILCCVLSLALTQCGGTNNSNNKQTVTSPFPPLNGSLAFAANSQVSGSNAFNVSGPLTVDSTGNVSATLAIASVSATVSGACFPAGTMISFTGMLTPQGQLTLASAASAGQTVNFTVSVSSDGKFFSNGSFTVSGGCLNGDHGTLTLNHLVSGTYTGSVMLNGNSVNVTVNFSAPGIPQLDGTIPIQASAGFDNNSGCGFSSAGSEGGDQAGLTLDMMLTANAGVVVAVAGSLTDSSAGTFSGSLGIVGGTCDQTKASITLTKS